jgi:putative transposase
MAPGRPAQHGAHERRHRTRTADATRPPERHPHAQQARVARVCREDNDEPPHEALNSRTPASVYRPSPRPMPPKPPAPAYPGHDLVRRGSHAGTFRFQTRQLCMSGPRLQQDIAVEETGEALR